MSEKSFWIRALTRVRREEMHPIAVPLCSDLSTLSLLDLQKAGKRTNRLMKNWMTPTPTMESIREMHVDAASDLIVIPGTGLVIVHGRGHVACWDIFTEECVARLVLPRDVAIDSAAFEEYGKVMLGAIATSAPTFHVIAICIDHRVRTAVTMSQVLSHAFSHPRNHFSGCWKVTVDHETVRVVVATHEPYRYHLLSVTFTEEERITEDVLPMASQIDQGILITSLPRVTFTPPAVLAVPSPSGPYFLRHTTTSVDVAHLTQSQHRLTNTVVPLAHSTFAYHRSKVPADPWADVVTFSASYQTVEFWPASREAGELLFGPVASYSLDLGRISGIVDFIAGTSGLYVLLVRGTKVDPLLLLRYNPGAPPVVRTMTMPSKPLSVGVGRLALDDHLGLVLSIREDGELAILSYA
ncbi:hypothetical protein B0H11DRAFT_1927023 [Mycena galericulata]|nr:hypothetical protein B0H11DRAFT_1927023 [Mycena galericulata]